MDKRIAKLLIAENQRMIQNVEMVKRNISFESHSNYVLVGLRRAGKSYLLYQRAQEMIAQGHLPEEILYFNFEDDRLENLQLSDLDAIKQAYERCMGISLSSCSTRYKSLMGGRNLHADLLTRNIECISLVATPRC